MNQGEWLKTLGESMKISKMVLQFGIALGVIITILYCGKIDYYPTGLTIGDTLFFIAVSLSATLTYTLLVLVLFFAGITFSPILRWMQKLALSTSFLRERLRDKDSGEIYKIDFPHLKWDMLTIIMVGLIVFLVIALSYYQSFDKGLGLTLSVMAMSIFYGLWNTKPKNLTAEKTEFKVKVILATLIFFIPISISHVQENILNQAMHLIGVRYENATIMIDEKYQEYLTYNEIIADKITEKKDGYYKDVTILFKGIGENTVLEIKGFKIIIPSKEVVVGKKKKAPKESSSIDSQIHHRPLPPPQTRDAADRPVRFSIWQTGVGKAGADYS